MNIILQAYRCSCCSNDQKQLRIRSSCLGLSLVVLMHIIVETVKTSTEEVIYTEPTFNRTNTEESVRHFSVYVYNFSKESDEDQRVFVCIKWKPISINKNRNYLANHNYGIKG